MQSYFLFLVVKGWEKVGGFSAFFCDHREKPVFISCLLIISFYIYLIILRIKKGNFSEMCSKDNHVKKCQKFICFD